MAKSFKTLLGDDMVSTRTMLHEAIPVTGSIVSGTYQEVPGTELNIKKFSHGMFESVYDYPFLSSSANHIFDVTYGYSSNASASTHTQNSKKVNIYNQMAQVLMGYDVSGNIRNFDSDGTLDDGAGRMDHCFFVNFSRLLTKDEIKKNSFRLSLYTSGTIPAIDGAQTIGDYRSANEFRTSPAGDYGLLFTSSADENNSHSVGLIFYQAGVAVLTSSIFPGEFGTEAREFKGTVAAGTAGTSMGTANAGINAAQTGSSIDQMADGFRFRFNDLDFNNTIELNSSIYFCRINHNEFNYSSNPTYVSGSKLRVKNNVNDLPVSYITTVGLYSPANELLAVAKLSEPIRKDPNTELTLRVRLDY
jgi:hypothetical protein